MTYTSLMANLDPGHTNPGVLGLAMQIAEHLHAGVIGIAAYQPLKIIYGDNPFSSEPLERDRLAIEKEMHEVEYEFRSAAKACTGSIGWRSTLAFNSPTEYIVHEARSADLLITGTFVGSCYDASRRVDIGNLVMRIGRPVLLVPNTVKQPSFERVVVGWTDTREAMRAISDALPLLKLAKQVALVEVSATQDLGPARSRLEDVAVWLKGHGVDATISALPATGYDTIQLNAFSDDQRADLIVVRAYGHSRMHEWAFGGVTRDLLASHDRCTLLSH